MKRQMIRYIVVIMVLCGVMACGGSSGGSDGSDISDNGNTEESGSVIEDLVTEGSFAVVDTGQILFFNDSVEISAPSMSSSFYGQDAQYDSNAQQYLGNGDGTVTDAVSGLMWQQSPDTNGDSQIDVYDKMGQDSAMAYCEDLSLAGYTDWRLPDIKTLYSLINFNGQDPSGEMGDDTSELIPFIDTAIFDFGYGDTANGERLIDAQWATTTLYVSTTMDGDTTMFGVNLADGRIKGYPLTMFGSDKLYYVQCVRGNTDYGDNQYTNNGDGTVSDHATGLMWQEADSGSTMIWSEALEYCENLLLADQIDWRLPDVKELQSIVDYTRSPDTTDSAAIDSVFITTEMTNENGQPDYGFYWSGTTHQSSNGAGSAAAYVSFGRALGYMNGQWLDVHGAGAQRSDPKNIDTANTNQYDIVQASDGNDAYTHGPQGDLVRGYNFARCVRTIAE